MTRCKICRSITDTAFSVKLLNKHQVDFFKCNNCEFLFSEEPYWLEEAYSSAISIADTGILQRNIEIVNRLIVILYLLDCDFNQDKFIDYAGGGGILVRLLRDRGLDFYWYDKYCQNWVANGFEADLRHKYVALTMFECLEHFSNPVGEVQELFKYSDLIIFTTELLPEPIPNMDWWYYSFTTGQHISFYSAKTLDCLAKKFEANFYTINGIHFFSKNKISKFKFGLINKVLTNRLWQKLLLRNIKLESKITSDHLWILNKLDVRIMK